MNGQPLDTSKPIDIYHFSGTGNTLLLARKVKEILVRHGFETHIYRMEETDPSKIDTDRVIGLSMTVVNQGTYPFVWEFLENLPPVNGTPVFFLDSMKDYSGGIVGPVRKILTDKGYVPIGAKEFRMPNNFLPKKNDEGKQRKIYDKALGEAEEYAVALIEGRTRWGRIPVLSDLMSLFSRGKSIWKMLRKLLGNFQVDTEKCTKCGTCVELCPVNNIRLEDEPVYGDNCYYCMRCAGFCPTGAIHRAKPFTPYRAVSLKVLRHPDKE